MEYSAVEFSGRNRPNGEVVSELELMLKMFRESLVEEFGLVHRTVGLRPQQMNHCRA
jgi:hypothetical protein